MPTPRLPHNRRRCQFQRVQQRQIRQPACARRNPVRHQQPSQRQQRRRHAAPPPIHRARLQTRMIAPRGKRRPQQHRHRQPSQLRPHAIRISPAQLAQPSRPRRAEHRQRNAVPRRAAPQLFRLPSHRPQRQHRHHRQSEGGKHRRARIPIRQHIKQRPRIQPARHRAGLQTLLPSATARCRQQRRPHCPPNRPKIRRRPSARQHVRHTRHRQQRGKRQQRPACRRIRRNRVFRLPTAAVQQKCRRQHTRRRGQFQAAVIACCRQQHGKPARARRKRRQHLVLMAKLRCRQRQRISRHRIRRARFGKQHHRQRHRVCQRQRLHGSLKTVFPRRQLFRLPQPRPHHRRAARHQPQRASNRTAHQRLAAAREQLPAAQLRYRRQHKHRQRRQARVRLAQLHAKGIHQRRLQSPSARRPHAIQPQRHRQRNKQQR